MSETLFKMVHGQRVQMDAAEEVEIRAFWAANDGVRLSEEAAIELEAKRRAAIAAIQDELLDERVLDPNAPQEVKDYAAALGSTTSL